ncbi:hypothetical protein NDU88_004866 [Pleurodeles waltl]|uniref:Uncharacterized protein n=1 Tax=Pleurodeles waltl TaxID=8319 RepID=A0AAV7W7X8_PLEWA|nr:hypothetical protein NDU88_004866 [Pleurodeles waltl]
MDNEPIHDAAVYLEQTRIRRRCTQETASDGAHRNKSYLGPVKLPKKTSTLEQTLTFTASTVPSPNAKMKSPIPSALILPLRTRSRAQWEGALLPREAPNV